MNIAILGTGSWGTALGQVLCDNGHCVTMYGIDDLEIADINHNHKNKKYFGDNVVLPVSLHATKNIEVAVRDADMVVISVPTRFIREVLEKMRDYFPRNAIVVNASKGFDFETKKRITDTIREVMGDLLTNNVVSVIGPSHAEEVILRQLTSVCAVSLDEMTARTVQQVFSNSYLRLYVNTDEIGAEYGVAIKNIIAIASGILVGRGYGDNAKAALVTRGLSEMIRYGCANGGRFETYVGLTGLGDLVVTCFSEHSRNYQAGLKIGTCDSANDFLRNNTATVEGIYSCKAVYEDLKNYDFEMPIVEALYRVLYEGEIPSKAIKELMERPLKSEH